MKLKFRRLFFQHNVESQKYICSKLLRFTMRFKISSKCSSITGKDSV